MEFVKPIIVTKNNKTKIKACYSTGISVTDYMVRGGKFYAVWDSTNNRWSLDERDVQRIVDDELYRYSQKLGQNVTDYSIEYLRNSVSGGWYEYRTWSRHLPDYWRQLDQELIFSNTQTTKENYSSKHLSYPLCEGDYSAWDTLVGQLYSPEEREKIEWAIGSIVSGDSKDIQKFFVFYGGIGSGKSTILKIIASLFEGYTAPISISKLAERGDQFGLESLKENPLVGIDDEADLRMIETNATLNALTSHATMLMNEKNKSKYPMRFHTMIFAGTNNPVRITDAKSGLIRRLIDISPTGNLFDPDEYDKLISQIEFQKGPIAQHCLEVYLERGKHYYDRYRPLVMMFNTDSFFNFVEEFYDDFNEHDGTTLKQAYELYKLYCTDANVEFKLNKFKFREQLKDYFETYESVGRFEDKVTKCVYKGFKGYLFESKIDAPQVASGIDLAFGESLLDEVLKDCPAQYSLKGVPERSWANCLTTLKDIDTSIEHYVRPPINLITIDFDLKDEEGKKSFKLNSIEAAKWPKTYAELSKGGEGIHLHYFYDGDPTQLARQYSKNVEVKVMTGLSSLRRRVSKCNNIPIATINSGLPLKEVKQKVVDKKRVQSEGSLRDLIERNLNKEIHGYTKPSIDFIKEILENAYNDGLEYDIRDLYPRLTAFALGSTNNAAYCIKVVRSLKLVGQNSTENPEIPFEDDKNNYVFFDVEVFPNLFVVCYKPICGEVVSMINPSASDIEELTNFKLIGFNNRRYDNHILYARMMGFSNERLYDISQRIINGDPSAFFGPAYGLSFSDIYDFSVKKESLKKFELDLGIHHQELGLPWNEPVDEALFETVADYCANDVIATEAVFNARQQDWAARQILSKLSGLTPNDITSAHMAKIMFGDDPRPEDKFVYTDLSEMFPGYEFKNGKTYYKGKEYGEGGLAVSHPGIYTNVVVLDIASMHPSSAVALNYFGPYTNRFEEFLKARLAVKHHDKEAVSGLLNGVLLSFMGNPDEEDALAYALKICINQVYGLTSAKFDNKFRLPTNVDNIIAKRGELFMLTLLEQLDAMNVQWCHVKTDSIKLVNPTPDVIEFVMEYGMEYGYTFEVEHEYERLCIVDKANYAAKRVSGEWDTVGDFFSRSYVKKILFTAEPITLEDTSVIIGTKVGSGLYFFKSTDVDNGIEIGKYIGRVGRFTPVTKNGYYLYREKDGKFYAAPGTKGWKWVETEVLKRLDEAKRSHDIYSEYNVDEDYFVSMLDEVIERIAGVACPKNFDKIEYDHPEDFLDERLHNQKVTNMFIYGDMSEVESLVDDGTLPWI